MATDKQIQAARENGAKSKGPTTVDGKKRSSQNARKHGFFSRPSIEEMRAVDALVEEFTDEWNPATPTETALVRQIAMAEFRLRRIPHMEFACTEFEESRSRQALLKATPDLDDRLSLARAYEKEMKTVEALGRHEARLQRQFRQALDQLRSPQKERRHAEAHAPEKPERKNVKNEPPPETGYLSINDLIKGGLVPGLSPRYPGPLRATGRPPQEPSAELPPEAPDAAA